MLLQRQHVDASSNKISLLKIYIDLRSKKSIHMKNDFFVTVYISATVTLLKHHLLLFQCIKLSIKLLTI
jgi:hypothetical protein